MAKLDPVRVEAVVNRLADAMARLLIDGHQQHLAELDLTFLQAQTLRILRRGASTTGGLATELRVTAPAITQLVDRLARKELVERRAIDGDRRAVVIALSAKGKRLVDSFRKRRGAIFTRALERMSGADQHEVLGALERMVESFDEDVDRQHETAPLKANVKSTEVS